MASGKGKAELTAVASDDDDAATAPISGREAQSRAGVLRQLRPDAQEHQVAASKAAAAKRSAGAMSKEERQAKRARHISIACWHCWSCCCISARPRWSAAS